MTGLKKLLMWKAASGGGSAPQTETVSGSLVTFETTKARPLTQCRVDFLPKQSGSGDPSPENVRPISGWNGLSVFVSPTTTGGTEYPVTWQSAGTVYGGYVDLVRGVLVATHECITSTWGSFRNKTIIGDNTRGVIDTIHNAKSSGGTNSICNVAKKYWNYTNDTTHFYADCSYAYVFLPNDIDENIEIQIIYELTTPITYTLTPQQINTLIGTNNIWSDAGEVTVTYTK